MNFMNLIYAFWGTILIFTLPMDTNTIFQKLKREVRFTKFEMISLNKSIVTVPVAEFKQFYDKQTIFVRAIMHERVNEMQATFSVSKCKEHYLDCFNVVSYDISDLCTKIKFLTQFSASNGTIKRPIACPIHGEYIVQNITLDADKFGTVFSFPTEKWWEKYWKLNILLYYQDKIKFLSSNLDFYFIEFRSRNRQHKN